MTSHNTIGKCSQRCGTTAGAGMPRQQVLLFQCNVKARNRRYTHEGLEEQTFKDELLLGLAQAEVWRCRQGGIAALARQPHGPPYPFSIDRVNTYAWQQHMCYDAM